MLVEKNGSGMLATSGTDLDAVTTENSMTKTKMASAIGSGLGARFFGGDE